MNIGVIGWWHYGNEGDFRILDCMTKALQPHRVVPIDLPFPLNEDSLQRLNLLDFVILGGGGLFQEGPPPQPFDNFYTWGQEFQTPIGVAGVGIDAILPEYNGPVGTLVEQAQFFYVRDRTSQRVTGHPKVRVAPDLTFLYPLSVTHTRGQSQKTAPICGVNVRKSSGFPLDPWMKTLQKLPFALRGIPMATYKGWQELELLRELDPASATAFDASLYEGLDMMIGMAFHSVVYAIQAAIPVICIAYAPKVRRLMADIGLERLVLAPDEWDRLPQLVDQLSQEGEELSNYLRETTRRLSESAWEAMAAMREEIERAAKPTIRPEAKVSIVVLGTDSNRDNRITVESCLAQTHKDVQIILATNDAVTSPETLPSDARLLVVRCDPKESPGARLDRAFARATGDFLTWVAAADRYAYDAVSCMANRLQDGDGCDMVFADYYRMREIDLIAGASHAGAASKLFRRDVVGPCFLYRRELGKAVGPFNTNTALVAYDYWLRARRGFDLRPMHTRLFYAVSANETADTRQLERQTRRQWRSAQPMLSRLLWQIVDSRIVENLLIRPLRASRNKRRTGLGTMSRVKRSEGFRP